MWVIAIFIVPAFVVWNIGSAIKNRRSGYAGKIFERRIQWKDYFEEKQAARNEAWMKYGDRFDRSTDLDEQTWTRLILLEEAKNRKIKTITNDELLGYIKNLPIFRFAQFDSQNYPEIVARVFQQTPTEFEQGIKHSLIINKLLEQITSGIRVDDAQVKLSYAEEFEQATADYILIEPKDFLDSVSLDDEQALKNYYENNKAMFEKPEQVNVEYIEIKLESFKKDINIKADRIEKYYENNKDQFKIEEDKDTEPRYETLAEVKDTIKEMLIEKEMYNRASNTARQIMNKLYAQTNLAVVAKEYGIEAQETGPFSMLEEIPKVGLSFPFLKAAFSLKKGEISEVVKTPTALYILKPIKKIAPYIPEYEEALDKTKQAYKQNEATKLAQQKAAELASQIKDLMQTKNLSLEDAAKTLGLTPKTVTNFTRQGYVKELGYAKEFTEAAFKLKLNEVSEPITTPRGFSIMQIKEITPVDEEKFEKEKDTYRRKVEATEKNKYLTEWFTEIKEKANPISYLEKDQLK